MYRWRFAFFCEDWFGHADRRKDIREKSPKEKINTLSIKPENKLILSLSILVTNIESSNFCYLKQKLQVTKVKAIFYTTSNE